MYCNSAAIYNNHEGVTSASKASASSDNNADFIMSELYPFELFLN